MVRGGSDGVCTPCVLLAGRDRWDTPPLTWVFGSRFAVVLRTDLNVERVALPQFTSPGAPQPSSAEQAALEEAVTARVLASFDTSTSARYRDVMRSLVTHLHAFARDVRLSQEEWELAIDFLTRAGHITTDRRQEFILLSDVLGLSMLTVGINAPVAAGATDATVLGPFFVDDAPEVAIGADIAAGAKGVPCYVAGTVLSTEGSPVPGARIEVWEADEDGFYDVQYEGHRVAARARMHSGDEGEYRFWAVRPAPYPIPHDGPVGDLLEAAGRGVMRPAHLHFKVDAPGYRTLITHLFVAGDDYLDRDAVFGVKDNLVVDVSEEEGGLAPDGSERVGGWNRIGYDLVLAPR